MGTLHGRHALFLVLVVLTVGCASDGPAVPHPPVVEVTQLDPVLISSEVIKFRAKISIQNRMNAELCLDRVDYAVDLHGRELFTSAFDQLKAMDGRGSKSRSRPLTLRHKGGLIALAGGLHDLDVLTRQRLDPRHVPVGNGLGFHEGPPDAQRACPGPEEVGRRLEIDAAGGHKPNLG